MTDSRSKCQTILTVRSAPKPWDSSDRDPCWLLTDPASDNPEGSAWDIIALALGLRTRAMCSTDHWHIDVHGEEYYSTNEEIELEIYSFDVSSGGGDLALLSLYFSVYIEGDREDWTVGLDCYEDIALLEQLLADRGHCLEILRDKTVVEHLRDDLQFSIEALEAKVGSLLKLLSGFDDDRAVDDWRDLPRIPMGWALLRIVRGWVKRGQFDHEQVEFVLWMIGGRSQIVSQQLAEEDIGLADTMKAGLATMLDCEYIGSRGAAGRQSPQYAAWKRGQYKLESELDWLQN